MKFKRILLFCILIVFVCLSICFSFDFIDFEKCGRVENYFIDCFGNRYYLWYGFAEGPLSKPDMTRRDYNEQYGLFLTKFSTSNEWKFTIDAHNRGIINFPHYEITMDYMFPFEIYSK